MSLLVLVAAVAILDMLAYWFGVDSRRLQPGNPLSDYLLSITCTSGRPRAAASNISCNGAD
jgi:hypothetical protein